MMKQDRKLTWARSAVAFLAVVAVSFTQISPAQAQAGNTPAKTQTNAAVSIADEPARGLNPVKEMTGSSLADLPDFAAAQTIIDPIIVESSGSGSEFIIDGFDKEMIIKSHKEGSKSSVQVTKKGKKYGAMAAPFAIDAAGKNVQSTYLVKNNKVTQKLATKSSTKYPVTLAPALIRNGENQDKSTVRTYHEALASMYSAESSSAGAKTEAPFLPIATRAGGIGIPSSYVYNLKHKYRSLHDYCTASPDSFGLANFRGSCAMHDMCIERDLKKSRAVRQKNRRICDAVLLVALNKSCELSYSNVVLRNGCRGVAATYYASVSAYTFVNP